MPCHVRRYTLRYFSVACVADCLSRECVVMQVCYTAPGAAWIHPFIYLPSLLMLALVDLFLVLLLCPSSSPVHPSSLLISLVGYHYLFLPFLRFRNAELIVKQKKKKVSVVGIYMHFGWSDGQRMGSGQNQAEGKK